MEMEQPRFPRRSASHGTLKSTYSSHSGGPPPVPSPLRSFHKPLRSVHENSVLLQSPGALESMLKTTTETGDIGIFTIKPVPPSPLQHGTFPGSDPSLPSPRHRPSADNLYRRNMVKPPPSIRDTASEIISMSGSDSQRSAMTSFSPYSNGDIGQRSFSMTTCGSRYLSHHRSTNTLQSQASNRSNLQRPRSPFPYPTRLKRPGVRPSSPALTENGRIDYSRMVEIDRVSYRTVHGHFKYANPQMPRKPHPLGLRAAVNRSTPSLPPPGPPPNFRGPPPPQSLRAPSPASMTSWNPSLRSASLTSVVNPYHRGPQSLDGCRMGPPEPLPRYYDYTEHFETRPSQPIPPVDPFHSSPERVGKFPTPSTTFDVADHLTAETLAAVFGEGDSAFFDSESQEAKEPAIAPASKPSTRQEESRSNASDGQGSPQRSQTSCSREKAAEAETSGIKRKTTYSSDIDLLPSQIARDSIDTFNQSLDLEKRDAPPSYSFVSYHANTTPRTKEKTLQRHVQVLGVNTPTIRSEQGIILRDDLPDEASGRDSVDSCHSIGPLSDDVVASTPELKCKEKCLPALTASVACTQPGALGNSHFPPRVDSLIPVTVPDSHQFRKAVSLLNVSMGWESENAHSEQTDKLRDGMQHTIPNHLFRRHRRNHATLRISTTNLPRDDNEGYPHIRPSCSTAPIISPKPISPARQLKVKNSIPQLMKALPPLPGDPGYKLPSTPLDVSEEDEFAEILAPFSLCPEGNKTLTLVPTKSNASERKGKDHSPLVDGPKFRLKIKTTDFSETSSLSSPKTRGLGTDPPASETLSDVDTGFALNKLKIRSPRRSKPGSPQSSTVRRRPDAGRSQVVQDLSRRAHKDLFTLSPKSESPGLRKLSESLPTPPDSQALTISSGSNEGAPSVSRLPPTPPESKTKLGEGDEETVSTLRQTHGLKKHLSNLRALLSPSFVAPSPTTQSPSQRDEAEQAPSDSKSGHLKSSQSEILVIAEQNNPNSEKDVDVARPPRLRNRIRAKLAKWVKGARTAVKKCAGKKHNTAQDIEPAAHNIIQI
ncbi:hypothetical protein F5Y16DRAFT_351292 [Xylariaceae sp. FL0255]|nr:hypothetical protein F5Y16DRAFT_351292 [Xylariaceae sp. FL0255]